MTVSLRGLNLGYVGLDRELLAFPHPDFILNSQRREGHKVWTHLPVLSYIIDHPDGRILFETGISEHYADEWPAEWQQMSDISGVTPETCLEERLKSIGLGPEDFRYVVMGHLHCDHAGGMRLFEEAGVEIICHADEYDHVMGITEAGNFYVPADWAFLGTKKPTLIDADQEIASGVHAVGFPGHTPGNMGLMIELEHTGSVILGSDAIHVHENCGPPPVANVLTLDLVGWAESLDKLQRLARQHDAFVFPGHDELGIQYSGEAAPELKAISFAAGYRYE
jgi:glyoxylase-like metal-dependent hydrolase (beta-lactamase superfamily II)